MSEMGLTARGQRLLQLQYSIGNLKSAYSQLPLDSGSEWSPVWDQSRLDISRILRRLAECEAALAVEKKRKEG